MIGLINADARRIPLPDKSVHMVVTSPPYFGLRDYGQSDQIGLEPLHDCNGWATGDRCGKCFVCQITAVFREVWRVLRDDGTAWLNLGDSYSGGKTGRDDADRGQRHTDGRNPQTQNEWKTPEGKSRPVPPGLKPKDLMMIPARVALSLQADGWYLRQDIIWSKKNPMPESVTDRCTKSHEYLFLLAKSARYFYDHEAVKENTVKEYREGQDFGGFAKKDRLKSVRGNQSHAPSLINATVPTARNRRSVWTISTRGYAGAHYATYPPDLVEPCIKAGTSERGVCPACGAPYERQTDKSAPTHRPDNPNPVTPVPVTTNGSGATTLHMQRSAVTVGWNPTCECNAGDPVPAIVFDPFVGSGTTLVVARALGRSGIGTDLSHAYLVNDAVPRLVIDMLEAWKRGKSAPVASDVGDLPLFAGL